MPINPAERFEKAKQEVARQSIELFEKVRRFTTFPSKFTITLQTQTKETGEISSTEASVVIPKLINYKSRGRLTGKIGDYQVSVINDSEGHFRVTIDDKEYPRLPRKLVEEQLGISVQKKLAGGSSETIGRAVWRHLTARYNLLDKTVSYLDEFVYIERSR